MRYPSLLFSILIFSQSCKTFTVLKKMNAEEVSTVEWTNQTNKSVVFLSMVHIGKPEFYQGAQKKIHEFKSKGYIVFYEGVKAGHIPDSALSPAVIKKCMKYPEVKNKNPDSLSRSIYNTKFRRMTGFYLDTSFYLNLMSNYNVFRKKMAQPTSRQLGIAETDLNIDVTTVELVNMYEKTYGEIDLEQIDFAVPYSESLPGFRKLKHKRVNNIIINYRNKNLAISIQNSKYCKILVVYGLDHQKGTFELLYHLDNSWRIFKN